MDAIADALGMDPLELRLRNVLEPGDAVLDRRDDREDMHYQELLRAAADKVGWQGDRPAVIRERTKVRAKGIATIIKGMSAFPSSSVAKLNSDGSINVLTGSVEMGQGALTALAQIAARRGDGPGRAASASPRPTRPSRRGTRCPPRRARRTTWATPSARAVVDVKKQLARDGRAAMEISPDDLEVVSGTVRPKGAPDKALPFRGASSVRRGIGNILGRGTYQAVSHLDLDGQGIGSPQWHPVRLRVRRWRWTSRPAASGS